MSTRQLLLLASLVIVAVGCDARSRQTEDSEEPRNAQQEQMKVKECPPGTVVTPYLEHRIEPHKNLVWCATFQMVWDALKDLSGGPVKTSPASKVVSMLNAESIAPNSLPKTGTFSAAGLLRDGIMEHITAGMAGLPGKPEPTIIPDVTGLPPDAVVLYAFLQRSLRFRTPFASLHRMQFAGFNKEVECFGLEDYSPLSETRRKQGRQVRVLWHRFVRRAKALDQEFVLELVTREEEDRVLLARIAPADTLRETLAHVMTLVGHPNSKTVKDGVAPEVKEFLTGSTDPSEEGALDRLRKSISGYSCLLSFEDVRIPRIRMDLTEHFDGLIGQVVVSGKENIRNKPIADACQRIRFDLDERGVDLQSEATVVLFGDSAMRDFSFSGPFLILLMRKGADVPYFALWVANAELLVGIE